MIKIENVLVQGWEPAIRGMRNPMNSWDKSDSVRCDWMECDDCPRHENCPENYLDGYAIGENDLALMKQLAKAGSDHRKFMRMIVVYVDVTAPLYWWKEACTYRIGTTMNSCSTMHKLHERDLTIDDFSHEHLITQGVAILEEHIEALNDARDTYVNFDESVANNDIDPELTCPKDVWYQMIQLLPSSYNQRRTWMLNYEVLRNIYHARKNHKLDEWHQFCDWIETLPHSELITGGDE